MNNIDAHSHFLPKEALDELGIEIEEIAPKKYRMKIGERKVGPLPKGFFDIDERVKEMDELGIDFQVFSVTHHLFGYNYEKGLAGKVARVQNDALAKVHRAYGDKVACNGTLPLSYPDLALKELEHIYHDLELPGIEIGTNITGKNLDSPELFPIYEKLQEYDMPILVHPNDILGRDRMKRYYLPIVVGTLLETTIAIASVIFGGVLDKFPRLKFIFCHGGGAVPYQIGRLQRALEVRDECKGLVRGRAIDYLKKIYVDTVVFDDDSLDFLVKRMGPENVVLGTDYPFNMGEWDSHLRVGRLDITKENIEKILVHYAKRLFKIG